MKIVLFVLLLSVYSINSFADDINITANDKVEWHQKEMKVVAIGNAVATKGKLKIEANTLTGYYHPKNKDSKNKIKRVIANGEVKMHSPKADALGNNLDYNLQQDIAILTGNPATIKTLTETISAKDKITYYPSEQKAIATGSVHATDSKKNNLFSDKMIAYFSKSDNKSENLTLNKVDILGNIKIITSDAEVTAEKGTYLPQEGLVKLFNNVIINQNGNVLKGDKAETNLNTGISKLLSTTPNSRVTGIFKEKK